MAFIDPKVLAEAGFSDAIADRPAYDTFNISGLEGTGKTTWALGFPKPLLYMSTDFGENGVIQKFKGKGQIIPTEYKLDIPHEYRAFVDREEKTEERRVREGRLANYVHENFYTPWFDRMMKAIEIGCKTVVWDNAVDVWEYVRMSVFGREGSNRQDLQTEANTKMRELVRQAHVRRVNLVMINGLKPRWENYYDSQEQRYKNRQVQGEWEHQGFQEAAKLAAVSVWTKFTPANPQAESEAARKPAFDLVVKKCRDHPEWVGQTLPALPFVELMSLLMPEVPSEKWVE